MRGWEAHGKRPGTKKGPLAEASEPCDVGRQLDQGGLCLRLSLAF